MLYLVCLFTARVTAHPHSPCRPATRRSTPPPTTAAVEVARTPRHTGGTLAPPHRWQLREAATRQVGHGPCTRRGSSVKHARLGATPPRRSRAAEPRPLPVVEHHRHSGGGNKRGGEGWEPLTCLPAAPPPHRPRRMTERGQHERPPPLPAPARSPPFDPPRCPHSRHTHRVHLALPLGCAMTLPSARPER